MTIHLSIPAAPKVALCGNSNAKRFTHWRWKAGCKKCKADSAATPYSTTEDTKILYRSDLPIRYSTLCKHLRERLPPDDIEKSLTEFENDKKVAGSFCKKCNSDLPDPIVLMAVEQHRMVFACPNCCSPALRERWEKEAT